MDERKIIERLAVIRELAESWPPEGLKEAVDALMQDMTFGNNWPHGDATPLRKPVDGPVSKVTLGFFEGLPRGSTVIIEIPE